MSALDDCIDALETSPTFSALGDKLQRAISHYGFTSYECVEISNLGPQTPFHFGTSGRWREIYIAKGFRFIDPALARARSVMAPFSWRSLPPLQMQTRQSLRILEAAAENGLTDAYYCPHHMRDADDRLRSHVCVFLWSRKADDFRQVLSENGPALHFIATHFMDRVATLRGLRAPPAPDADQHDITIREREVLELASRGRTSLQIAEDLQISTLTAQTHMKNAIRKMHASNRTHAVSLAIARGLVRP